MIITTQKDLNDFCAALAGNAWLTIDTEFLRDKTYYPKLCLLQMAGPGMDAKAVDPIGTDLDWTPVYDLMQNEKVLKVFHAARQDLEIFVQLTGKVPHPIFDTQVASMVCGYGDQVAYNALVQGITGHSLSKSAQFTDWSRRPLSDKQLTYALDDVIYLREVYEKLDAKLIQQNREHWVFEEMGILTSLDTYNLKPEDMWKRIKIRSDKPEVLAALKALAAWRELEAQQRNIPRQRILKDETLADIALYMPRDLDALTHIRTLPNGEAKGKVGAKILEILGEVRKSPKDSWPRPERRPPFPRQATGTLEMLKMLLRINCAEADVAPKLVADSEDLERLAVENAPDVPTLHGWRLEVFGNDAVAMKEGKISLGLKGGQIVRQRL